MKPSLMSAWERPVPSSKSGLLPTPSWGGSVTTTGSNALSLLFLDLLAQVDRVEGVCALDHVFHQLTGAAVVDWLRHGNDANTELLEPVLVERLVGIFAEVAGDRGQEDVEVLFPASGVGNHLL